VLSVVHDFANMCFTVCHHDQVHSRGLCLAHRFRVGHDPDLTAIGINQTHIWRFDLLIRQSFFALAVVLDTESLQTQVLVARLEKPVTDAHTTQNRAAIL